jgi:hypothetical protein
MDARAGISWQSRGKVSDVIPILVDQKEWSQGRSKKVHNMET